MTRPPDSVRFVFAPGAGVLLALALGAAPAALLGLEFAWVVMAIGVSALTLSCVQARAQVRSIRSAIGPENIVVHAGRSADQVVELTFRGRPRSLMLSLTASIEEASMELRAPMTWLPVIRGDSKSLWARLPLRVTRRGPSEGAFLRIESGFPFGLVTATRRLELPCSITALPRLVPERDLFLGARLRSKGRPQLSISPSHMNARAQGSPVSLRSARYGDTLREIHVRASLRRGRWVASERAEETDGRTTILLECLDRRSAALKRGQLALEAAVSVVASLCQGLTRDGREVRVVIDRPLPMEMIDEESTERRVCQLLGTSRRALPLLHSLARFTETSPLGPADEASGAAIHVQAVLTLRTATSTHALQVDPEGRVLLPIPAAGSFSPGVLT